MNNLEELYEISFPSLMNPGYSTIKFVGTLPQVTEAHRALMALKALTFTYGDTLSTSQPDMYITSEAIIKKFDPAIEAKWVAKKAGMIDE